MNPKIKYLHVDRSTFDSIIFELIEELALSKFKNSEPNEKVRLFEEYVESSWKRWGNIVGQEKEE